MPVLRRLREPRTLIFAAIFLFVGVHKLILAAYGIDTDVDGGFYTDIATHVRDGEGFVTNVSILHKGMPYFPHPSTFYPLWPLVYGYTARLVPAPIVEVGFWLSTILSLLALALADAWARRSFPGPLLPRLLPHFDSGHLFLLMLGLNWNYFFFSNTPHTEALAYTLFFAGLLRLHRHWSRPGLLAGLEMGVWCGLVVLTRTQLMLLPMALWATLLGATLVSPRRRRYALMGLGSIVAFLAVMAPYYFYLKGFVYHFDWTHTIRVDSSQVTGTLSEIVVLKQLPSVWDYLVDRADGFRVAFAWGGGRGYWRHYYVWHYALFVAIPALAYTALRLPARRTLVRDAWRWLTDERNLNTIFVLVYAAAGFLSIHTMHKDGHGEWNFQRRHGLTSFFLFFLALRALLVSPIRAVKAVGILLLVVGTIMGGVKIHNVALRPALSEPNEYRPALVRWINEEKDLFDPFVVAARKPQLLARHTPGVGYHWYFERTSAEDMKAMVETLGVAYVVINPAERSETYPFYEDPRFDQWFAYVGTFSGFQVYRPTPALKSRPWREFEAEFYGRSR